MRNIEFNCIDGIYEVEEIDAETTFLGWFVRGWKVKEYVFPLFDEKFQDTRSMRVSEEIFELLHQLCGIKKL